MFNRFKKSGLAIALCGASALVAAQGWPSKTITIVVPFPPGGTTDVLARVVSTKLSATLGQTVIVDNKPGAGATLGAAQVAKATPDGYTLLMGAVRCEALVASIVADDEQTANHEACNAAAQELGPPRFKQHGAGHERGPQHEVNDEHHDGQHGGALSQRNQPLAHDFAVWHRFAGKNRLDMCGHRGSILGGRCARALICINYSGDYRRRHLENGC